MFEDNSNEPIILTDYLDDESGELIQLVSEDDEGPLSDENLPDELPILPIKNTVLFPGVVIPITVSRNKSIKLVKKAYKGDRIIGVVAQKNHKKEEASFNDLYEIGTVAKI